MDAVTGPAVKSAVEAALEAVEAEAARDRPDDEAVVLQTVEGVVVPAPEPVVEVSFDEAVYIV